MSRPPMRARRSDIMLESDRMLLIEEKMPPNVFHHHSHKRFLARHVNAFAIAMGILLFLAMIILFSNIRNLQALPYDDSPLSLYKTSSDGFYIYRIGVVTDLDHDSFDSKRKRWISYFKEGELHVSEDRKNFTVVWSSAEDLSLYTNIAAGNRAMELSDLVVFNKRLLTIDDRTGLIYEIVNNSAVPWIYLGDGPGTTAKPFKGEWMTVKDNELWIGGLGKEWTTSSGEFVNDHPMWVKVVDISGRVRHVSWTENYRKMRTACGYGSPGYMIHESGQWSKQHRRWFFLPRRASGKPYDEKTDEYRGTNILISADEFFNDITMVRIGPNIYQGSRGYSAFQFVPNSGDELIIALKSEEIDGHPTGSFISVFDIQGNIIFPETALKGKYKFEGLSFI